MKETLTCPHCGGLIELVGKAKKIEREVDVKESDIKALFPKSVRGKLSIDFEGNFARVNLNGKMSKALWVKTISELKGFGGKYVKGYFLIPIVGVHEEA